MSFNPVLENLRRNIQMVGQGAISEKLKSQEEKDKFQSMIKEALVKGAISGRVKPKAGADFNNLNLDNPNFGQTLGKLGSLYEPAPAKVSTSISTVPASMSDLTGAAKILATQPQDFVNQGLATRDPQEGNILGFNTGRKTGTGLFGSGFGPGSQKAIPTMGPEATGLQDAARKLMANPTRTTTHISNGGQVLGQGADSSAMPDASQYQEGTQAQDDNGDTWKVENGAWVKG